MGRLCKLPSGRPLLSSPLTRFLLCGTHHFAMSSAKERRLVWPFGTHPFAMSSLVERRLIWPLGATSRVVSENNNGILEKYMQSIPSGTPSVHCRHPVNCDVGLSQSATASLAFYGNGTNRAGARALRAHEARRLFLMWGLLQQEMSATFARPMFSLAPAMPEERVRQIPRRAMQVRRAFAGWIYFETMPKECQRMIPRH